MIAAQEQAMLEGQEQLQAFWALVERAGEEGWRVDQVERELFAGLLKLGHTLLGAFVARAGDGDEGNRVEQGERTLRRSEAKRPRRYVSIFGELAIERYVYAVREGRRAEYLPLDARLGLPADDFSYVLVDWQQRMCLKDSFAEAVESLDDPLGVAPSVRAAEHGNRHLAEHAEAFRVAQGPPDAAEEGEILVLTADGKGVPMRRPSASGFRARSAYSICFMYSNGCGASRTAFIAKPVSKPKRLSRGGCGGCSKARLGT